MIALPCQAVCFKGFRGSTAKLQKCTSGASRSCPPPRGFMCQATAKTRRTACRLHRSNVDAVSVTEAEVEMKCEISWDPSTMGKEDLQDLMLDFQEGVQFSKARVHGEVSATTDAYNREMCERMGSDICYYHEWGMNYSHILPNLIVGSVPQDPDDIDYLRDHLGITAILNLQEEKDWQKFQIDFGSIQDRCNHHGDIKIVRCPIVDFDSSSLRQSLPSTVTRLHTLLEEGHTVYVHCTAGLGRAPGVAITYLHWMFRLSLEDAYSFFTAQRPCNPRTAAIRGATMDMHLGQGGISFSWDSSCLGKASHVEVTGCFNDWAAPGLQLKKYADGFFLKEFCMLPGLYQYKFIADGEWRIDPSLPTCNVDGNVNNVVLLRPADPASPSGSTMGCMD